jgi:hypothetical protein
MSGIKDMATHQTGGLFNLSQAVDPSLGRRV